MPTSAYMFFQTYTAGYLASEAQVDVSKLPGNAVTKPFSDAGAGNVFEIMDYSFEIEQTLNIGSQSTGAGAGKVTFNPFSITRVTDRATPVLFEMACAGTAFKTVGLAISRSGGNGASHMFMSFLFKLVAVKTIAFALDADRKETVTFEYGGLQINYSTQTQTGAPGAVVTGGWNRVSNTVDHAA